MACCPVTTPWARRRSTSGTDRAAGVSRGSGTPTGLGTGTDPVTAMALANRARTARRVSVSSSPRRSQGSAARRSVRSSISRRATAPDAVGVPSSESHPRSISTSVDACQASSSQPRATWSMALGTAPVAAMVTSACRPSSPAATRATTCPSPRCSRSTVAACHNARWGSSGQGSARLAAANGRPSTVRPSSADRANSAARAMSLARAPMSASTPSGPRILPRARSTPASRASSTRAGATKDHATGRARATRSGLKLKKVASTTAGPTGPMGAARPAK